MIGRAGASSRPQQIRGAQEDAPNPKRPLNRLQASGEGITLASPDYAPRLLPGSLRIAMVMARTGGHASLSLMGLIAISLAPIECSPTRWWGPAENPASPTVLELDSSFGVDGISFFSVLDDVGLSSEVGRGVTVLPDGRIAMIGSSSEAFFQGYGVVALLDGDGTLDPSFGDGGIVVESFEQDTHFSSIVVDGAGRLVIGGYTKTGQNQPSTAMVARYLLDGSRDPSFGSDPDLIGVTRFDQPCSPQVYEAGVQADGAIVATGRTGNCADGRIAALRFLPDGSPDATFGDQGMLLLHEGYGGEILLWGYTSDSSRILVGSTVGPTGFDGARDFSLTQLSNDGELDSSFGTAGSVVTDFGDGSPGRSEILTAAARTSGKMLLAGGSIQLLPNFEQPWQHSHDLLLARYGQNGTLDSFFGNDGFVTIDFGHENESVIEVLVRSNGNIVVVGISGGVDWEKRIAIAHLSAGGSPAPGEHRAVTMDEAAGLRPTGAALDKNGRLIVAGNIRYQDPTDYDYFVARYLFRPSE